MSAGLRLLIRATRPALVLVVLWPGGMSARDLVELLRADPEKTALPVVVCWTSAAGLATADGWVAELGCETLPVPFEIDQLREKVAHLTASVWEQTTG